MVDVKDNKELEAGSEDDFEYEYEYVEVPEGEEVPESEDAEYEYEYEYVEVPEGEETSDAGELFVSADEELPIEKELPAVAEDYFTEKSETKKENDDLFEEIDLDSFLKETGNEVEEVNLDDIIVEELEANEIEEINVDDILAEDEDLSTLDFDDEKVENIEDNLTFEYTESSGEKLDSVANKAEIETISLDDIEVEEISLDDIEVEEIKDTESLSEEDLASQEKSQIGFIETAGLESNGGNEPISQDNEEIVDVEYEAEAEDNLTSDSDFKPFVVSAETSNNSEPEMLEVEGLGKQTFVSDDFAELLPSVVIGSFAGKSDELQGQKTIAEEVAMPSGTEFNVLEMSDDDYLVSIDFSKVVTKSDGVSVFYSTRKQNTVSISDIDMTAGELSQWNLVILDRKMVSLNEHEQNIFPRFKNSVRLAKLIKNGQERVSFFNEEEYSAVPQTDSFGMVSGKFIVGALEEDSGLLINDFINISLYDFYGKKLQFMTPVSGMLVGPKGSILYFSNLKNLILPRAKISSSEESYLKEVADAQGYFEISAQDEEKTLVGIDGKDSVHINVGITTYGWNVVFDNEVTMSVKDLMTYQSRNGKIPFDSGKICYGRKVFKFENIKSVSLYETPQYFSYGR